MRTFTDPFKILDAKAATGIGTPMLIRDYRHLFLALDTASSANLTVKFQLSFQKTMPDFAAAQSPTNQWDYVQIKDLESGSSVDGDTGIAPAGTDDHRHFEVNINGGIWLCAVVTARSAGSVTVSAVGAND